MTIIVPNAFEANYTLGFVKGLKANQVDPHVVTSDLEHQRVIAEGIKAVNLRGSVDERRSAISKAANLLKYYFRLCLFLIKNRRSIVHFTGIFQNSRFFIEGFGLNLWFRLFSRRYLYTVHNVMPHGKENHRIFRWLYWLAYRIPNVLIVHTTLAKQQLTQQFGMAQHKIQVVSIGLNEEMPMTDLTPAQARRRLGYGDTEKIFLFFGKMDEYKGLDLLLQAFDQLDLPDIKLHVAGVFRDLVYRQKIMLIISQARRKNDIRLDERMVPNEEVEILFKGADMLAMPYRNIYQSGLLFLCYRFGMPLVATDVGSLREFVGPDMGLIVKPNDIGSFADGLWRFCTSKILYNRENIRAKGIKYQWPSICRCLVPLYQ